MSYHQDIAFRDGTARIHYIAEVLKRSCVALVEIESIQLGIGMNEHFTPLFDFETDELSGRLLCEWQDQIERRLTDECEAGQAERMGA